MSTDALRTEIVNYLNGTTNREEAISYLRSELYSRRWRGIGTLYDFQILLEEMGFTFRKVYTKNSQCLRTIYVGLPKNV